MQKYENKRNNGGGISGLLPPSVPVGINTANYVKAVALAQ